MGIFLLKPHFSFGSFFQFLDFEFHFECHTCFRFCIRALDFVIRALDFVIRALDFVISALDFVIRALDFVIRVLDFSVSGRKTLLRLYYNG